MTRSSSTMRMAVTGVAAAMVYFGAPLNFVNAQDTSVSTTPAVNATKGPVLSYGADEVTKLYQSGVAKDVIVSYVNSSMYPYRLTADQIIYLQKTGIPQEITRAMLQRDGQLQEQQQAAQQAYQQPMSSAPNNTAATQSPPVVVTPTSPAPDVTVIGSGYSYPAYDYSYPYYDYGYWPPVVVGGWGWGWGGRGGWGGWGGRGFRGGFGGFHGGFHGGFGGFHGGIGGFHGGFGGFHGGGGFGGHGGGGHR